MYIELGTHCSRDHDRLTSLTELRFERVDGGIGVVAPCGCR